jgi:hypothetical protein
MSLADGVVMTHGALNDPSRYVSKPPQAARQRRSCGPVPLLVYCCSVTPTSPGRSASAPARACTGGAAEPTRQLAANSGGDDGIPFSNWAAILVILFGVAALYSGFAMRRAAHNPTG